MGKCCSAKYICGLTEFIEDVVGGGGGGGGTPGAPVNSVQYNSAGAFAGDSAFTYSGTALALTGTGSALTLNRSASALTTSLPALSITQTWNAVGTTFTGAVINVTDTASAAASKILDAQLGGVSRLNVNKSGLTAINGPAIAGNGEILTLTTSLGTASLRVGTGNQLIVGGDIAAVGNASLISATAHLKFGTGSDAGILYTAAGALKVTDGSSGKGSLDALSATLSPAAALTGASAPALTITQTWNNVATTFTAALVNITDTASNAVSKLFDAQLSGATRFNVTKDGVATAILQMTSPYFVTTSASSAGFYARTATNPTFALGASDEVILTRDAADTLAQRRSTNAQKLSVYNTYTGTSDYERGVFDWKGTVNSLRIGTEHAGSGVARPVSIVTGGTERINVSGSSYLTKFQNAAGLNDYFQIGAFSLLCNTNAVGPTFTLLGDDGGGAGDMDLRIGGSGKITWRTGRRSDTSAALGLVKPVDGILGITNGSTGPGKLAIDNVQGTNLERLKMEWASNVARIGTEKAGSGTARDLAFITDDTVRMVIYGNGGINTGGNAITAYKLQQTSSRLEIQAPETIPASATAGNAGSICYDSDYIYVAVSSGSWKRVALSAF